MDSSSDLLMQAIYENDIVFVKYCLRRGLNLNKICKNGMTHLGAAAQTGNLVILQTILEYVRGSLLDHENNSKPDSLQLDVPINQRRNIGYFVVCKDTEENEFGEGPTPDGMEALEWDTEITDDNIKEEEPIPPEVSLYKWYAKILNQTSIILQSPDNDIARLDNHGQNILHYAIRSGNKEMVEYLLENCSEISVNQSDSNWFSPLHIAAINGNFHIVKFLLSKNANVNSVNRDRQTPLHLAAQYGYCEIINLLLESGANINAFDIDDRSALTMAILYSKEESARLLIKKGIRLNHEEVNGYTPLYRAVWNNLTATTKLLLEFGAKVIQSHYLLQTATRNFNVDVVRVLLWAGAIPNIRDDQGNTPLIIACSLQQLQIAKCLLKHGASPNTANHVNGMTPLHNCIQDITDPRTLQQFVELLISNNVNLNASSYQGNALFYAIILGNLPGACLLVKHGIDVNLRDERACLDNLSLAKKHGNLELVKLIVYAGFDFDNLLFDIKSLKVEDDDPVYNFLVTVKSSPMNLREMCRIVVRKALGKSVVAKIYQLPLPTLLQKYVALDIL